MLEMFKQFVNSLAQQFNAGGNFMWVILVLLAVALAIFIERLIFYFISCNVNGRKIVTDAIKMLNADNISEARKIVQARKAPVNNLLVAIIDEYEKDVSVDDIQEGVERAAIQELPKLTSRLNYLSLFANIATLMGLLGTIAGLQVSFSSLATAEASKKAALLASGIAEAMNCTAFGLMVAIPCMIAYTALFNKQQRITKDLDDAVSLLMSYIKKRKA